MTEVTATAQQTATALADCVWGKIKGVDGELNRTLREDAQKKLKDILMPRMLKAKVGKKIDEASLTKILSDLSAEEYAKVVDATATVITDLNAQTTPPKEGKLYRDEFLEGTKADKARDLFVGQIDSGSNSNIKENEDGKPEDKPIQKPSDQQPGTGRELTPEQRVMLAELGLTPEQIDRIANGTDYASVREKLLTDIKSAQAKLSNVTGGDFKSKQEHLKIYDKLIDDLFDALKDLNKTEADEIKTRAKERTNAIRDQRKIWSEQNKAVEFVIRIFEKDVKEQYGEVFKDQKELERDQESIDKKMDSSDRILTDRIGDINNEIVKIKKRNSSDWRKLGNRGDVLGAIGKLKSGDLTGSLRYEQSLLIKELRTPGSVAGQLSEEDYKRLSGKCLNILEKRKQTLDDIEELKAKENSLSSEPKDKQEAIMRVAVKYCADRGISTEGKDIKQLAWELYNTGMFSSN